MKKPEPKTFKNCPHFLKAMKTCGLFSEGFYIPTERNISTYCMTAFYEKCPVYKRHYNILNDIISSGASSSRRQHKRIPDQRKVMICSCDQNGNVTSDFSEKALMVDYSQGGMHIIAGKKLPAEKLLMFRFEEDFLIPGFEGLAELRWQKKLEKSPKGIEAGLLFKDNDSRKALALEIEHKHSQGNTPPFFFPESLN